jgi:hypothetical protein
LGEGSYELNGPVYALAVYADTVYYGGSFTYTSFFEYNNIAAYDAINDYTISWNPSANGIVYALAVSGRTVYAAGDFTSIGGGYYALPVVPRNHLAALDRNRGKAWGWNPDPQPEGDTYGVYGVSALAVSGGTVYAGGGFYSILGLPHSGLAGIDITTIVDVPPAAVLAGRLRAAPNPFNANVALRFSLPETEETEVEIYDLGGRLVRDIHHGVLLAGEQHLNWDGRNDAGRPVSAGLYFARIHARTVSLSAKLFRVK